MSTVLSYLATALDLALVVLGFGAIIFVHELGHFVAARWAGIRVLAFAMGFGPAACSFRRGLGWRRGSSEGEYEVLRRRHGAGARGAVDVDGRRVHPTEYRLNWVPFGGYVKMLGQDDADPTAVSAEADGYQAARPWRRMVVISAGVVMNVLTAALLFCVVFWAGLRAEPPVVGDAVAGSPAAKAVAENAAVLGVTRAGLMSGDRILSINGRSPNTFNDLVLATAMTRRGASVDLEVRREGVREPLRFRIVPEFSPLTGTQDMGVEPARSTRLPGARSDAERRAFAAAVERMGLAGVEPGMTLVRAGTIDRVTTGADLRHAFERSGGLGVELEFSSEEGRVVRRTVAPIAELDRDLVEQPAQGRAVLEHVLGLTPVLRVGDVLPRAEAQGLRPGDVFARLGAVEYPSVARGIAEIRSFRGRTIASVVLRSGEDGSVREEALTLRVDSNGRIGFGASDTARTDTLLASPPARLMTPRDGAEWRRPAAEGLGIRPGARVVSVGGVEVRTLADVRSALRVQTDSALAVGASAEIPVVLAMPEDGAAGAGARRTVSWLIPAEELRRLHGLGWSPPAGLGPWIFEPERMLLRGSGPIDAMRIGLRETQRVVLMTYVTFLRLIEGTVKVEQLKGPVGIAHLGTIVLERGAVWFLFFLAIVSINLAVINFLPLPVFDGGQFVFLLIEQARGRPVPVGVQNAFALVGMILIASVFVLVTINDVSNLFGP